MNERREGALLAYPKGREGGPARLRRVPAAAAASRGVGRSAMARVAILGGALAAVLLLLPTFPVAGINQSLDVTIVAPQREYAVGDVVPLTVHVLRSGVHRDADFLGLYVGSEIDARALVVGRTGVGVYESTLQVSPRDVENGAVRIIAEAWTGGIVDQEVLELRVGGLEVAVYASALRAPPGASIDITVGVREWGVPRDVDLLVVVAKVLHLGAPAESADLVWARTDIGTYRSTYSIPKTIAQATALIFGAQAFTPGASGSGGVVVLVEVPPRIVVWSHVVSASPDEAVVEILVADETGRPEAGATVALTHDYFDPMLVLVTVDASGTTDDRGVASFHLAYEGTRSSVDFRGTVTVGSESQKFQGSLGLPMADLTRRVDVRRDNPVEVFAPGETATLEYLVRRGTSPARHLTLYYVAHTDEALVASGVVTSDADGRFTLQFPVSAGYTTVEFASQVDGLWVHDTDVIFSANRLSVDVGGVYLGGVTRISAALPDASAPWIGFLAFRPYAHEEGSLEFPWSSATGAWGFYEVVVPVGGSIEHDIVVPAFLPKGADYLLSIRLFPQTPSATDEDVYVYHELIRIENQVPIASARLSSASIAVGLEVEINASASSDVDGVVEAYEVDWGDGTTTGWSANETATHTYAAPGEYNVTVQVRDDDGAVGWAFVGIYVEPTAVGLPPLVFIAIALSLVSAAAAAVPMIGPRIIRLLAKPGGTAARHTD